MAGISINNILVGKKYRVTNFDEKFEFEVMKRIADNNFSLKDIHSLDNYDLLSLIMFGKGNDFEVEEL